MDQENQDDKERAAIDRPDWRGFDEQVIPDGVWHYQHNAYASDWRAFCLNPRSMTGVVNTWIWRLFGFQKSAWIMVGLSLHVFNTLLIYMLMIHLGLKIVFSLAVAFTFLFHPIQVPAILQTAARSGVQSATFAYAALCCLSLGFWPVAVLSQFLAIKSKEDAWGYMIFWPIVGYFSNGT